MILIKAREKSAVKCLSGQVYPKSPYLNEKSSDFDEIWYTNADLEFGNCHMTNYEKF